MLCGSSGTLSLAHWPPRCRHGSFVVVRGFRLWRWQNIKKVRQTRHTSAHGKTWRMCARQHNQFETRGSRPSGAHISAPRAADLTQTGMLTAVMLVTAFLQESRKTSKKNGAHDDSKNTSVELIMRSCFHNFMRRLRDLCPARMMI